MTLSATMSGILSATISGIGVWGPGFNNLTQLKEIFSGQKSNVGVDDADKPSPERIARRERRRAPLRVKLAVEVAGQACDQARIDVTEPACVFASGMGDTDITDHMCRALAGADKLISPTRFHNSVHNASVGYWTMATNCQQAATAVAGFTYSFPLALLEAMVQVTTQNQPVLLVIEDIATPVTFQKVKPITQSFAMSLLIRPYAVAETVTEVDGVTQTGKGQKITEPGDGQSLSLSRIDFQVIQDSCTWPNLHTNTLTPLYDTNPAARGLLLMEALLGTALNRGPEARSDDISTNITLPLSATGGCVIKLHQQISSLVV